jgi:hypothetical protein
MRWIQSWLNGGEESEASVCSMEERWMVSGGKQFEAPGYM